MVSNRRISQSSYCRRCLNAVFGMNLERSDVLVYNVQKICEHCKEQKWIVYQVRSRSFYKLIKGHKKEGQDKQ